MLLLKLQLIKYIGPKEINGLLVPPGKAPILLTGHLITGYPFMFITKTCSCNIQRFLKL